MSPAHLDDLDVGVVVVTYNSERHLPRLLGSLPAALGELSWQAVVVDNASSDGTVARLGESGCQVIEMGGNAGYAAAINRGRAALPGARALLVLNPDLVMAPGAVVELYRALQGDVGITSGQTWGFDDRPHLSLRRQPSIPRAFGAAIFGQRIADRLRLSEVISDPRQYLSAHDVDWMVGSSLLISSACDEAVGEWDERYFLYSEETDYCERARRAGFRIRYVPSAHFQHEGGHGADQPVLRSIMAVNRVRHYRTLHGGVATRAFFAGVLLNEATRAAAGNRAARAAAAALVSRALRPVRP